MDKKYYKILIILVIVTLLLTYKIVSDIPQVQQEPINKPILYEVIGDIEINETKEVMFELSDYERWVVECMVMGESGGESYIGKALVAQCILNACLREDTQPSVIRTTYQYSGWHEEPTDEVKDVVSAVFDEGYKVVDEPILYFYAPKYVYSEWHETQRHVITEGGHKFFARWED